MSAQSAAFPEITPSINFIRTARGLTLCIVVGTFKPTSIYAGALFFVEIVMPDIITLGDSMYKDCQFRYHITTFAQLRDGTLCEEWKEDEIPFLQLNLDTPVGFLPRTSVPVSTALLKHTWTQMLVTKLRNKPFYFQACLDSFKAANGLPPAASVLAAPITSSRKRGRTTESNEASGANDVLLRRSKRRCSPRFDIMHPVAPKKTARKDALILKSNQVLSQPSARRQPVPVAIRLRADSTAASIMSIGPPSTQLQRERKRNTFTTTDSITFVDVVPEDLYTARFKHQKPFAATAVNAATWEHPLKTPSSRISIYAPAKVPINPFLPLQYNPKLTANQKPETPDQRKTRLEAERKAWAYVENNWKPICIRNCKTGA